MILFKYPWQQFVLDAYMEFNPDRLPAKIDEARRVISARLGSIRPDDVDEQTALSDAMRSLRVIAA
jgi:hypothetical protein